MELPIRKKILLLSTTLVLGISCSDLRVESIDPRISRDNEILLFQGKPFDGILVTHLGGTEMTRLTPYLNGLPNGVEKEYYPDQQLSAEREYKDGKKVGMHKGFYGDGQRRFKASYKDGEYDGAVWEWNPSGSLYSYTLYNRGHVIGKKLWRSNGQIYVNFVMKGNRAIGLTGTKLCYQVGPEEGSL